ncbi:MAG: cell division FtsA domain-containing protein [Flavobacteriales bacterium]|nr:cell division FtsA domain-containing protein [Flavobacteriales bacterium]
MSTKISPVKNQTTPELLWNAYDGNPFDEDGISDIRSDMENVEIPVTSIPSPFSQMHLFATAFSHVNTEYKEAKDGKIEKSAEDVLNEKSTYNRAISDCLDLFEILYSYEILSLGDNITIRTWDKNELKRLKASGHTGQKTFAETLEVYGNSYSDDPRFYDPKADKDAKKAFDQFILIYFNDRILAAGSPLTGFFFNREKGAPKIKKHDGKEFFSTIIPLYRRDIEFQIFLSIFFGGNAKAVKSFSELNKYRINNNEVGNNEKLQNIVVRLDNLGAEAVPEEYQDKFKLLNIGGNSPLYLLGESEEMQYLYKAVKSGEKKDKASKSDYAIKTSKTLSNPPLALIEGSKKKHWKLLDGPLEENIDLRKDLAVDVAKRKLPGTTVSYPYLQQGDLFADHLIQLRYDVNEERFWAFDDQDNDTSELKNILLPIKPAYFKYFTLKDLKKQLFIERQNSGSVVVKLNIPVRGDDGAGVITFRKKFSKTINPADEKMSPENGAIINSSLGFGIYPFFRVDKAEYNDQYKILQYCDENEKVHCDFIREDLSSDRYQSVTSKHEVERTRKEEGQLYKSKYTELSVFEYGDNAGTKIEEEDITFDMVVVKVSDANDAVAAQGIIFPNFPDSESMISIQKNSMSKIAFDIGTSNSYVAWSAGEEDEAFDIDTYDSSSKSEGLHLALLHKPEYDDFKGSSVYDFNSKNNDILRFPQLAEFLPSLIGSADEFSLPLPTVINVDNDADPADRKKLSTLINVNIPFGYGFQALRTHGAQGMVLDQLFSNLKWAVSKKLDKSAMNRLFLFIDQLGWMARNKILSQGLDPSQTEVIWFKPLSMGVDQRGAFTEIWNEVYDKYFGKKKDKKRKITSVTESWAPFFSQKQAFGAGEVYMNIDIGGGTTDILIFNDGQPALRLHFVLQEMPCLRVD